MHNHRDRVGRPGGYEARHQLVNKGLFGSRHNAHGGQGKEDYVSLLFRSATKRQRFHAFFNPRKECGENCLVRFDGPYLQILIDISVNRLPRRFMP